MVKDSDRKQSTGRECASVVREAGLSEVRRAKDYVSISTAGLEGLV
jgi:hypothetical protein